MFRPAVVHDAYAVATVPTDHSFDRPELNDTQQPPPVPEGGCHHRSVLRVLNRRVV